MSLMDDRNIDEGKCPNNSQTEEQISDSGNKKIAKNYFFNVLYQVFSIILPLILTPYVSRVLTASGVGQFSFSTSIITYFTLFAAFGFNIYGQREVSKKQTNKKEQSKVFFEIVLSRLLFVFLSIVVNVFLSLAGLYGEYSALMLILTINLVAIAFDISFFFQGNEQFGKIVIGNIIVKLLGLAAIFLFVKNANDVWLYTLINALATLATNIYLWFLLYKKIEHVSIKELDFKSVISKSFLLFLPSIVISIYTVLDRTMIGLIIRNDAETGYYDQAEKLVKMSLVLLTCLGTVMIPRNSSEYSKKNYGQVKKNVYFAVKFVWLLGVPLMFGIISISRNLNSWFFGDGYEPVIKIMMAFSPLVMAIGLNNVLGVQYLISVGKEKAFTLSVVFGAIINLSLNFLLLFTIGTIGAVIASVVAETCIFLFQLIYLRKEFSISKIMLCGWKNIIAGTIMFIVLLFIERYFESSILNTVILVLIGMSIYGVLMLVFRDELVFALMRKVLKRKAKNVN